jgi:dihydrofolate synthase/folylpolyglutamate synthase
MSYKEALVWLYATQRFGIKLGLENISKLLDELRLPRGNPRIIHVAGTNGKGSVCAMIDSICRAQGYHAGLFTSPHLVTFRERIRVNGEMISEECVTSGLTEIRDRITNWDPYPTFFEIATALGLLHFAGKDAEIIVLETGMGGRLDATNALQPVVSVITPIDLDHQAWLGDTLEKIAAEKAGIIKREIPIVSARQKPDAEKVLRIRSAACDAPIQFITEPHKDDVSLIGVHQQENAALAIAGLRAGEIAVTDDAIRRGLTHIEWPARFQIFDDQIVIDGAHNIAGAQRLVQTWREVFHDEKATLVFGVLKDKNAAEIYRTLSSITDSVLLPTFRGERAMAAEELAQIVVLVTPDKECATCASCADAIERVRQESHRVLIAGSLHFAGEMLAILRGEPAAFEECAQ